MSSARPRLRLRWCFTMEKAVGVSRDIQAGSFSSFSARPRLRLRWCFTMEEAREERREAASEKTESSRSPALDLGEQGEVR